MINPDHFNRLVHFEKIIEKPSSIGKTSDKTIVLNLLDQGLYAQEIVRRTSLSASFLSKTISSLKKEGTITQIQSYPKVYKLNYKDQLLSEKGERAKKHAQNELLERKIKPVWLKTLRVHKLRFKNELYGKPSWLYRFKNKGIYKGIKVRVVNLNNWTKHILEFHYDDFNGLEKIEICNNVIIYNFNRIKDEQYVKSKESLRNYINERIEDCKDVRTALIQQGFSIDSRDPTFCQKPHLAVQTKGTPGTLGALGKYLIATIEMPEETREIDDSPKLGEGEEETDNLEKAESIFDVPERIENVARELSELKIGLRNDRRELINGIKEAFKEALKEVLTSDLSKEQKELKIKSDMERMFQ
jgi:DNA-binding IscR family transcriptional regulator